MSSRASSAPAFARTADPADAEASFRLGLASLEAGDLEAAARLLARASSMAPRSADCLVALGETYRRMGRTPQALDALLRALPLQPASVRLTVALGRLLEVMGEVDAAVASFERAVSLDPSDAADARRLLDAARSREGGDASGGRSLTDCLSVDGLLAFARTLHRQNRFEEAVRLYRRAALRSPERAAAHNGLGIALLGLDENDAALESFLRVVELDPGYALGHYNVGTALQRSGRVVEACEAFRKSLAIDPHNAPCRSSLVYTLSFHPAADARAILAEARTWDALHAAPDARARPVHASDPTPDRRLRVGYVSPDFHDHCQSFFTVPLFEHHDPAAVEVFCYSSTPNPDATTSRLVSYAHRWQDIRGLSDDEAAALVERDRVDVLVDLTMHMARNRLGIFGRRPAPVQICWLAYPGTTGLRAMDWRITDRHIDPPDGDAVYSERSLRLPDTFWCYDPLCGEDPPGVGPLPALARGHVTFGCLNGFTKIHDAVLALWARALREVPGSRLVLRVPVGDARARTLGVFAAHGVTPDRLTLVPPRSRREYLESYRGIDVCLDTFPYNGHTTSLDAFWMGVPVVTLVGRTVVGRAGLCLAMNLGLPELVARDENGFVEAAVRACADRPRLADLRASLRDRMQRSPLMNAPRFAGNLEAAYREAWREWCEKGPRP